MYKTIIIAMLGAAVLGFGGYNKADNQIEEVEKTTSWGKAVGRKSRDDTNEVDAKKETWA